MTSSIKERSHETDVASKLPRPFILRRLHSLLGLWLVIYLCEHLLVNSQAALFFQDDGYGFITAANNLEALPYLKIIELVFLGVPFFIHGVWGMYYAWTAKPNAHPTNGDKPSLPQYRRNRAYSWQRITSWLLVVAILVHVIHMRFWSFPSHAVHGDKWFYMVKVNEDKGLPLVAEKLNVSLYQPEQIIEKENEIQTLKEQLLKMEKQQVLSGQLPDEKYLTLYEHTQKEKAWIDAAQHKKINKGELLAVSSNPGASFFLIVRDTFKNPLWVVLYSLFVVAATFHAFDGVWTFMITWGVTLSRRSQKIMRKMTNILMGIVTLLGLMAAWGTYWTYQFG